jgi:hypothetical protein
LDALAWLPAEDGNPAFYDSADGQTLKLEYPVKTLGEPRSTSVDALFEGRRRIAVEVKLTEAEFGRCSLPRLRPDEPNFARGYCNGSYIHKRERRHRCSLTEQGIRYWDFIRFPEALTDWLCVAALSFGISGLTTTGHGT